MITKGSLREADSASLHEAPGHDAGAGGAPGPDAGWLGDAGADWLADGGADTVLEGAGGPDEGAPIAAPVPRVVVVHAASRPMNKPASKPTTTNMDPVAAVARWPLIARSFPPLSIDRTDPALSREDGAGRT
ncbi:MAG: hypothetical protein M3N95_06150 [Actinomycetota bacterium]|nr:hypothetical protein [Actinomycetota bacterium]